MTESSLAGFLSDPCETKFGPVFDELYPRLYRYFAVRGLANDTAAELSSDVLWAVFRNVGALRQAGSFYGWLFQIARNQLLHHRRRHHEELVVSWSPDPVAVFTPPPQESRFYDWIQCLAEDEREICVLRYVDDLDYRAIGEAMDMPIGTVKWKLNQVKQKISQQLPRHTGGRR